MPHHPAYIFQINLSNGGVPKQAVPSARIMQTGLQGDAVRHPKVHGGPDRAVSLFSLERIVALQHEGHPVFPGALGENLTLSGVDWEHLSPGDELIIGSEDVGVRLQVVSYVQPCNTIAPFLRENNFRRVQQDRHPGWSRLYTRVLREGSVNVLDAVHVVAPG